MAHLNEVKYAGMEIDGATLPKINEREHEWLSINGVSPEGTVSERWYRLFGVPGKWNEAAHAWLTAQGVSEGGTLNERFFRYWLGEIIIPPPPLDDYDPLETHPDWTAVGGPSTLEWNLGEIEQDVQDVAGTLVYMNGSSGTDVIGQFRTTGVDQALGQSFNIVCRATNDDNFTGLRVYEGVYELWECTGGSFVQRALSAPPPQKDDLVQLILSGNGAIARINGVNYKSPNVMTRLGAGFTGVVSRNGAVERLFMGRDYGYLVSLAGINMPDLTLTAGNSGGARHGYDRSSYGAVAPDLLTDGNEIRALYVNNSNGRLIFRVEGTYPQNEFTSMEIVGVGTVNTAAAMHSTGGGETEWRWNGTGFSLVDTQVYAVNFL
jgi:hypothetical protein